MHLYEGAVLGIRNPRGHTFLDDSPERALEYIGLLSLLANRLHGAKRLKWTVFRKSNPCPTNTNEDVKRISFFTLCVGLPCDQIDGRQKERWCVNGGHFPWRVTKMRHEVGNFCRISHFLINLGSKIPNAFN